MKYVKAIIIGQKKRTWFIGVDETVWVSDPENPTGLSGDVITFCMDTGGAGEIIFKSVGPWCSNPKALLEETGVRV